MIRSDNGSKTARASRVFVAVTLALLAALILAAIIVPLSVYRSRGEVIVSYGNVTVRRDLYVYWLSAYKYSYLRKQARLDPAAADTPAYWNGETEEGVTRAAAVRAEAEEWIKRVVFASALFEEEDRTLGEATLADLEDGCGRLLQYELDTVKKFNKAAKPIGFRYETVRRAFFYQTEGESYVSPMNDTDYESFGVLASREVTIGDAAGKIDFVSLATDARLYNTLYLP